MKRSVILMGGKTHVVSLPSEWVRQNGITKGQQLEVEHELGKVTIHTDSVSKSKKAVILEYSKEKLSKAYQLGYDEIKLTSCPSIEQVEDAILGLPGFEIVHASNDICLIRSISDTNKQEFEPLLRRLLLLYSNYTSKDKSRGKAISKIISMCKRAICRHGYKSFCDSLVMYSLLCGIENSLSAKCRPSPLLQEIQARFSKLSYEDIAELKEEAKNENTLILAMQEVVMARSA